MSSRVPRIALSMMLSVVGVAAVFCGAVGGLHAMDSAYAHDSGSWSRHPAHVTTVTGETMTVAADDQSLGLPVVSTVVVSPSPAGTPFLLWTRGEETVATEPHGLPYGHDVHPAAMWLAVGLLISCGCLIAASVLDPI